MPSLISGFEYDIFISYRQKDNKGDRWVTEFVNALKSELEATFKDEVSVYFDESPHDGLLETHQVEQSLSTKIKSLVFIPIISQTYCDPRSFAWQQEFLVFINMAREDRFGKDIKVSGGNVSSRILPVRIHDLDPTDTTLLERELGGPARSVNFIYKSAGVNRPLRVNEDNPSSNLNKTFYRDQINKVAHAVKEIIQALENLSTGPAPDSFGTTLKKDPGLTGKTSKKVSLTAFLLLAAIIIGGTSYFFNQRDSGRPDKSIAVIPFTDLSQEHDQEYFGDGMMEEIVNHLSKISDLRVISRTSSMKYKGAKLSVSEIAKELGVTNILEGSVRKSGNRIRITVQLIDVTSDRNLWSEDYDYRQLKDIFEVQSEVSTRVAEILRAKLTPQEKGSLSKKYTENPQAYQFYLKGRHFWDKRTKESFDSAEVYFKRAIDLDPEYALAYSGLADCYIIVTFKGTQFENLPIADSYLTKALSLDSTLSEAWTTVGFIRSHMEYDWKGSRPIFEKAIRLNPNYPLAHLFYANMFFYPGDKERGMSELRKALDLDPLSTTLNYVLGRRYYELRDYDQATVQLQKTLKLTPDYPAANLYLGLCYVQMKDYLPAIEVFKRLPPAQWTREIMLSYAYSMAGDKAGAKILLEKTLKEERITSPYLLSLAYIGLGDTNKALTQLERAYETRDIFIITLRVNPELDPLRNEPRFKALQKKTNLE